MLGFEVFTCKAAVRREATSGGAYIRWTRLPIVIADQMDGKGGEGSTSSAKIVGDLTKRGGVGELIKESVASDASVRRLRRSECV